jgi:hypothetical protein
MASLISVVPTRKRTRIDNFLLRVCSTQKFVMNEASDGDDVEHFVLTAHSHGFRTLLSYPSQFLPAIWLQASLRVIWGLILTCNEIAGKNVLFLRTLCRKEKELGRKTQGRGKMGKFVRRNRPSYLQFGCR